MKKRQWAGVAAGFILILALLYNSCGAPNKFETLQGTTVGNPLAPSNRILQALCGVVSKCNPQAAEGSCAIAVAALPVDYQLGLAPGTYSSFSSVISADQSGTLASSPTNLDVCLSSINNLSCSDSSVQAAYDPAAPNPYSGVLNIVPTAPGACPSVFAEPKTTNDYYVATTGDDNGDGSQAHPWATISHAAVALTLGTTGATVHVAPGTYNLPAVNCPGAGVTCGVNTTRGGTATARITYLSDQQGGAKLVAPSAYEIWYNSGDYVDIVGFEMAGGASSNIGLQNDASFVRVTGNHIHGIPVTLGCSNSNGGGGIIHAVATGTDNDTIGNIVHDIGPALTNGGPASSYCNVAYAIAHQGPRGHIYNNIVYKAPWGLSTWVAATNLEISHDLFFSTGMRDSGGTYHGGAVSVASDGLSGHINDNTSVTNNIIRDSAYGIYEFGTTGAGNFYANNLLFNVGVPLTLKNGLSASGMITADPLMVNYAADGSGDYRLTATSPAVNAGTLACAAVTGSGNCTPANDITGFARPYGAGLDLGPYEWRP